MKGSRPTLHRPNTRHLLHFLITPRPMCCMCYSFIHNKQARRSRHTQLRHNTRHLPHFLSLCPPLAPCALCLHLFIRSKQARKGIKTYRGTSLIQDRPPPRTQSLRVQGHLTHVRYRGTSLIRKRTPLGPYRRPMPRVLGGF